MPAGGKVDRSRQRLRTRKDLLRAASRILEEGRKPTMEEVAEAAMVSRATAYRYFGSIEALLVEAPIDALAPDPEALFAADDTTDPVARVDRAEAALHAMTYRNEPQLRILLASRLSQASPGTGAEDLPVRQNRRTALIEAALAPARKRMTTRDYRRLCAALALIFGLESMVVFQDVLALDEAAARKVKRWAIGALVRAALREPEASA